MTANTKVSALDHAMHNAHTWVNDVAKEFDTEDREFVYGVLLHYLPPTQMNKALDQLPPEIRALLQPAGVDRADLAIISSLQAESPQDQSIYPTNGSPSQRLSTTTVCLTAVLCPT